MQWININPRDQLRVMVSRIFQMLDARIPSALKKDYPEFLLQEKGQSGGTESPERGRVSTRKADRLHDLRLLSSEWRSWFRSWLCWLFSVTLSHGQYSGIRYEMGWNSIIYDQDPTGWYLGIFVQIENTWRQGGLLSVESKRTVFERRPMQFPARQSRACEINTKNRSILWATNSKR